MCIRDRSISGYGWEKMREAGAVAKQVLVESAALKWKVSPVECVAKNNVIYQGKQKRKVLFTVDDGLISFYENAWPILKKERIVIALGGGVNENNLMVRAIAPDGKSFCELYDFFLMLVGPW